ncbi:MULTISPECIES: TetR family transcriptional regulator [Brucella]|jgi:TetR/AcrR family acrAB operon transcriptional repressor|uniref:TetR family transcriptional regulator n=1 Tax=Brucella/Ochrobactrum group TaxID=2826938 RepID=UPI0007DA7769|nr:MULTISPECIES: TetR family transcriptional regulator [Brucella]MQP39580.1 TetR family transcriptional regulator [Ochrobactrum sp. MYb237]QWK77933.1 TetR family transcriptional regulator [Ochrobactrum sp. BTU1]ANG95219.1 TetR family transcriptional regulator [Brucella pseudogrignonensis]PQZ42663.1 TetR family transcriptional regulator [Brucella pseudogrignonensis]PRA42092.1 TetR family transcriptional regulator [Brucella pseudogrignonensis]
MRRTKAEAAETRDAILTAAEHVFLERGLTQSTLMEIAGHAGVTRGAIYFHFHDKLDIFQALINRTRFPHEEIMLQAAACDHPNPLYVLEQSILTALELFITNERQQNLFTIIHQRCEYVGEIAPLVEHLKEARANVLSLFTGLLEVAERRGELSSEWTSLSAAQILLAVLGGLLNEWLRSERGFDLVSDGGKTIKTMMKSMRREPVPVA